MTARPTRTAALLVMLAFGLTLSACGRRGPLEPPPTPEQIKAEQARDAQRKADRSKRATEARQRGDEAIGTQSGHPVPAGDESHVKAGPGEVVVREEDKAPADQFNPQMLGRPQKTNRAFVIPKRDFVLDPLL